MIKSLNLFFIAFIISGCSDGFFMEKKGGMGHQASIF